ncbi:hypothetical protein D9M68_101340 [compost metagenome]
MASRLRDRLRAIHVWLAGPALKVKSTKRTVIRSLIRSRLFFIVALLTALSELSSAAGALWKATHPKGDVQEWMLWALVVLSWLYFLLVFAYRWIRFRSRYQNG